MQVELLQEGKLNFLVTFLVSCLSLLTHSGVDSGNANVEKHLEMGRIHLENHQFHDALTNFHAAVEGDPTNYQIYYKRALVFMALGKYHQALKDFDKVIELKPDFLAAVLQRASLLLKQGELDQAHIDFEAVLRKDPGNPDAITGYQHVSDSWKFREEADYFIQMEDCTNALNVLTHLIEISPWDAELRQKRANCYLDLGDSVHAISDLRFTTKLNMDDTDGIYRLSSLQYQTGELEESLKEIRECLKLDPEHKHCFPLYKKLKKLDKFVQDAEKYGEKEEWEDCITDLKKALKVDTTLPKLIEKRIRHKLCWCYLKNGDGSHATDQCTKALEILEDVEILCDRAEAYLLLDFFDEAINDYRKATEIDEDHRRAREGYSKAQKLQKQAKKRDYYKILGVKRNANKKEIIKAYRKLAQKWHPDNFSEGDEKKAAEAKFIDIAAAKEVLTDPEKRSKFDNGEDPLDAEQNSQNQGFNPFTHFHFQQSGGGPFHFKFH